MRRPLRQRRQGVQKLRDRGARDRATGCLLWTGGITSAGYGSVWLDGRSQSAHAVAYELAFGPIPAGKSVAHTCLQSHCFELSHLTLRTPAECQLEAMGLSRAALRSEEILAWRGRAPAVAVAQRVGCTPRHVYRIWQRGRAGG